MRLVKMPRLGQDMEEGTVVEWAKAVGDRIEEGEILAVIETEKAEVAFESPASGFLVAVLADPGTTASTGAPLGWIADDPTAEPPPVEPRSSAGPKRQRMRDSRSRPSGPATRRGSGRKPVSPLARRRAGEMGVDLSRVEGTGPGGRITEDDVMRFHDSAQAPPSDSVEPAPKELSRMRRAIADRMTRSAGIPQFHLMREVVLRKPRDTGDGPKVTYTDLLLRATARALKKCPQVNSGWVDGDPPRIRTHPTVDLGFAVAVEDGLIVPVIRDADSLALAAISRRRRRLEDSARRGRLRPEDLGGGTFTVSNLGGAGVDEFIALINPPEAGILAVGAVKPRPAVVDGALRAALTVKLTLTGDHRVFDGMEGARFLAAVADGIRTHRT